MIHIVYKTTNSINGKFYIGVHSCETENDTYLGSGTLLRKAIIKYGRENFKRKILKRFMHKKDAYKFERKILSKVIQSEQCYNISEGGNGGNTWTALSEKDKKQLKEKMSRSQQVRWKDKEQRLNVSKAHKGRKRSKHTIERLKNAQMKAWKNPELLEKHKALIKERMQDPKLKEYLSAKAKARYAK